MSGKLQAGDGNISVNFNTSTCAPYTTDSITTTSAPLNTCIEPWNPWKPVDPFPWPAPIHVWPRDLEKQMEKLIKMFDVLDDVQVLVENTPFPKCDVYEKDDCLYVEMIIPHITKDKLDVSIDKKTFKLTVKGESHQELTEDKIKYHKKEISRTSFKRTLALGARWDLDSVICSLNNGILKLQFSKSANEEDRYKTVSIE